MKAGAHAPCHSTKSNDHCTPAKFLPYWEKQYGKFHLDAAATARNTLCKRYITAKEDALTPDIWLKKIGKGHRVFVNPPYSLAAEFVEAAHYYSRVIKKLDVLMLLPVRAGSKWWPTLFEGRDLYFLRGRIKFKGSPTGAPFDSCVVWFSPFIRHTRIQCVTLPREVMGY